MAMGKVTTQTVDHLVPGRWDIFLWDSELSGFGVRVTAGGAKSYIYQFRMGGRGSTTQRYTIGRHRSPWTARTARAKATRLAKQIAKGKNPALKRRERRRREVELRFATYVEAFTEGYLKRRWKDWQRTRAMLIQHAVPVLGNMKLSEIKRRDLSELYRRLDNKPSVARALHAALRKMFHWALSQDDLKHSPAMGAESPPTVRPRTRFLSAIELSAAWQSSFSLPEAYGQLFRLLILTGQRRGEVVGLQWYELDRASATWVLPQERSKNRREHTIPLSSSVIAEFDSIAGGAIWPREGQILLSRRGTLLSGFSKVKEDWDHRIRQVTAAASSAEMEGRFVGTPWRLHDLRRTVATGMQSLAVRTEVIEAVLNHMSGVRAGLVGTYQCYDFQREKREALDRWAEHVEELGRIGARQKIADPQSNVSK